MQSYPKLKDVKALDGYRLLLSFATGEKKVFDFASNLSHPYYQNLKNPMLFKNVKVNDGEVEWITGQDFCPHTLYDKSADYTEM